MRERDLDRQRRKQLEPLLSMNLC